jgi:hypothetical protein
MSKLRCWPGCIAFLNGYKLVEPSAIGGLLEVIRLDTDHPLDAEPTWVCRTLRPIAARKYHWAGTRWEDGGLAVVPAGAQTLSVDRGLTPITPPPGSELTDTSTGLNDKIVDAIVVR